MSDLAFHNEGSKRSYCTAHETTEGIFTLWFDREDPFWPSPLGREAIQTLRELGGHYTPALSARLWLLTISRVETTHRRSDKPVYLRLPERDQIIKELFPRKCHRWNPNRHREGLTKAIGELNGIATPGYHLIAKWGQSPQGFEYVVLAFPKRSDVGPKLDLDKLMQLGQRSKTAFFMALEASLWFGRVNVRVKYNGQRSFQVPKTEEYLSRYEISKGELLEWSQRDWHRTKKALEMMEKIGFCEYREGRLTPHEDWAGWGKNSMRREPQFLKVSD